MPARGAIPTRAPQPTSTPSPGRGDGAPLPLAGTFSDAIALVQRESVEPGRPSDTTATLAAGAAEPELTGSAADAEHLLPYPVVAREVVAPAADGAATPPTSSRAGAEAPASAPSAAAVGMDVDELVRRIFDPLVARLKAELWLDRERAGLVANLKQ